MPLSEIERTTIQTKEGHSINIFYNNKTKLLVVDIAHSNGNGGNEIMRSNLNFKKLLRHCGVMEDHDE
jgi:hypothetical protein